MVHVRIWPRILSVVRNDGIIEFTAVTKSPFTPSESLLENEEREKTRRNGRRREGEKEMEKQKMMKVKEQIEEFAMVQRK